MCPVDHNNELAVTWTNNSYTRLFFCFVFSAVTGNFKTLLLNRGNHSCQLVLFSCYVRWSWFLRRTTFHYKKTHSIFVIFAISFHDSSFFLVQRQELLIFKRWDFLRSIQILRLVERCCDSLDWWYFGVACALCDSACWLMWVSCAGVKVIFPWPPSGV